METLETLKAERAELNRRIAAMEQHVTDQEYNRIEAMVLGWPRERVHLTAWAADLIKQTPKRSMMLIRQVCDAHGLVLKRWKSPRGVRGFIIYTACR